MAGLISCKSCGNQVSPSAPHCPKCGAVVREPNTLEYHEKQKCYLVGLIAIITVLYLLVDWIEDTFGKFPKLF
ncbi:MAG: zinc ribbon domain-containing protein [Aliarcobacter sp.]|nr:zinc ribbon domain-containing protein [Aliarcobacter sp.]